MEEATQLELYLQRLNRFRWGLNTSMRVLRIVRSVMLALCLFLLWAWIKPEHWGQQLTVFVISLLVFLALSWQKSLKMSTLSDWLLALEMHFPNTKQSALGLRHSPVLPTDWQHYIDEEFENQKKEGVDLLLSKAATLLLPLLCLIFLFQGAGQAWNNALHSIERVARTLSYGAQLKVVEGSPTAKGDQSYKLGSGTIELTLLEQNLIEINVVGAPDAAPMVQLKDKAGKPTQTFRLVRSGEDTERDAVGRFAVKFALNEDADLYLSTVSINSAAAKVHVKHLPVPEVELATIAPLDEAWPDDRPLPLSIRVKAEHPLQALHLSIKSGERAHRELVTEVLAVDKHTLETSYSLPLEPYMEQDLQELEIVAEATDRALPTPLIGRSKPIIIKVASAYGRYRATLETLKELKSKLDEQLQDAKNKKPENLGELGEKAARQSEDSPYFDALDRQTIREFQEFFAQNDQKPNMSAMMNASDQLNRFLFEHESLDDRERDRDFFIAARSLSRLLEQKTSERKVPVSRVVERMRKFLDERHKRWEQRVAHLETPPVEWQQVQKKPFDQALQKIQAVDSQNPPATQQALQVLSQTVESYRQWIEALEAKEDAARQQQEQKRQKGLANAQDQLRELQKRQSLISSKLDKASERQAKDLEESWASVRLEQNSNIKGTRELEGQLRSLSPGAGERMKAALDAMESTIGGGNSQKFVEAESASDFAGRLLQQAESAARKSQQEQGKRGRRRRVTSDQYYGNQVDGGDVDLRRDYEVNRRYREDVLDDVRQIKRGETSEQDDAVLEDYLRKVVR